MKFLFIITLFLLTGCDDKVVNNVNTGNSGGEGNSNNEWLIPVNEVFDGGPGKDGIPSIDDPQFVEANSVDFLKDDDLVVVIKIGEEIKIYPHLILDWHEIVNDEIGSEKIALTYCPLTGSALAWERIIDGTETTFGVSGLLYNSNLIPYDRKTGSNWSQMLNQSVNGEKKGDKAKLYNIVETKWKTVKNISGVKVLSTSTGFSRSYGVYPYGDYKENQDKLIFPVKNKDSRLPGKTRVLGVIFNDLSTVFPETMFGDNYSVIETFIGTQSITVIGSKEAGIFIPFLSTNSSGNKLELKILSQGNFPDIITDKDGNVWNVFGENIVAKTTSENLITPEKSFIAYWFAWTAFNPDAIVMGQQDIVNPGN